MRCVWGTLGFALALGACDDGGEPPAQEQEQEEVPAGEDAGPPPVSTPPPAPLEWCESGTAFVWGPGTTAMPAAFPDDLYTVDDPGTPTGVRVSLSPDNAPWLATVPGNYDAVYLAMNALDGFGTSAAVFLRFDGPVQDVEGVTAGLRLLDLGDDVAVDVPYEPVRLEDGHTLALWPVFPLRPATPHGVLVTTDLRAADGDCIAPDPALRALLEGEPETEAVARLAPRFEKLLAMAEVKRDAVSAALVFTTQTVHDESARVAADIAGRTYRWATRPTCQTAGAMRRCEGTFKAHDYRKNGVVGGAAVREYEMPVSLWLPATARGPLPTVVIGHGLGGDRSLGGYLFSAASGEPVAMLGIDAVGHGQHPAGAPSNQVLLLSQFFAVDIGRKSVDAPRMRDNFRQSTYDKLQLVQLIRQNPDFDGDGQKDFDVERIGYVGVSLGGIMGTELLALTDAVKAAVLGMPGGRLSQIMRDSESFGPLIAALLPPGATDGDKERLFAAVQTVLERGDPVNYAPRVLEDRLPVAPGQGPHVLIVEAIDDEIVPNSTTETLARAYQLPLLRPFEREISYLPVADAPVKGNFAGGAVTAGLFQYDEVRQSGPRGTTRTIDATHESVMAGRETLYQFLEFHRSWVRDGTPTIMDPYEALGAP